MKVEVQFIQYTCKESTHPKDGTRYWQLQETRYKVYECDEVLINEGDLVVISQSSPHRQIARWVKGSWLSYEILED